MHPSIVKSLLLLLLAASVLAFTATACGGESPDYANVRWGMTVDETREALQKSGRVILSEAEGDYGKIFHVYDGEEYLINATHDFTETFIFKKTSQGLGLNRILVKADGLPLKDALPKLMGQLKKPEAIPAAKNILNERLNQWPDSLGLTKGNGIETSRTAGIFAYNNDTVRMQLIPAEDNVSVAAYGNIWWGMEIEAVRNALKAAGRANIKTEQDDYSLLFEGATHAINTSSEPQPGLELWDAYLFRRTADNALVLCAMVLSAELESREGVLKLLTAQYGALIPDAANVRRDELLTITDHSHHSNWKREFGIQSGRSVGIIYTESPSNPHITAILIPSRENVPTKLTEGNEFDYANIVWEMTREQTEAALKARGQTVRRKGDVLEGIRNFRDIVLQEKFNFDKNGRFTSINIAAEDDVWTTLTNTLVKTYGRASRSGQRTWEYSNDRIMLKASETGGGDVSITITPDTALVREIQAGNRLFKDGKIYMHITVRTAREFIAALGSNRTIRLEPGVYNLFHVLRYQELSLSEVQNLTIQGIGKEPSEIVTDSRDGFVLLFEHSSNISISNIVAGHTDGADCAAGVFSFRYSSNIKIDNTHMYGCGTVGLEIIDTTDMSVKNSSIYECSQHIIDIRSSKNISFENCVFRNNEGFHLLEIVNSSNITIDKSEFRENVHHWDGYSFFFMQSSQNVLIKNTKFTGNAPITRQGPITFENCTYTDNERAPLRESFG